MQPRYLLSNPTPRRAPLPRFTFNLDIVSCAFSLVAVPQQILHRAPTVEKEPSVAEYPLHISLETIGATCFTTQHEAYLGLVGGCGERKARGSRMHRLEALGVVMARLKAKSRGLGL